MSWVHHRNRLAPHTFYLVHINIHCRAQRSCKHKTHRTVPSGRNQSRMDSSIANKAEREWETSRWYDPGQEHWPRSTWYNIIVPCHAGIIFVDIIISSRHCFIINVALIHRLVEFERRLAGQLFLFWKCCKRKYSRNLLAEVWNISSVSCYRVRKFMDSFKNRQVHTTKRDSSVSGIRWP